MDCILNYEMRGDEDYYAIIGCDELSTKDQILCEYKVKSLLCHPDKNPGDPIAVQKFQNLLKAKEILTEPEKRTVYDKWCRSGFSMSFEQFLNLNKSSHTSMHWACKKQKELMIEHPSVSDDVLATNIDNCKRNKSCTKPVWTREAGNELLRRFRNYEV